MNKALEEKLSEMMGEIKDSRTELKADLKLEVGAVKSAIEEVFKVLEPLKEKVEILETKQEITDQNLAKLRSELQAEIFGMKVKNELSEQYNRRENLIINGIPLPSENEPREDVYDLTMKVAAKLNVPLTRADFVTAHRLPPRKGEAPPPPSIIAKLVSRDKKNEIIKNSKKLHINGRDIQLNSTLPIFCDEHLTKYTQDILLRAKQLKKANYLEMVWVRDGVVRVKEYKDGPSHIINHISQLEIADYRDHGPSHQIKNTGGGSYSPTRSPSVSAETHDELVNSPVSTLKEKLQRIRNTEDQHTQNAPRRALKQLKLNPIKTNKPSAAI